MYVSKKTTEFRGWRGRGTRTYCSIRGLVVVHRRAAARDGASVLERARVRGRYARLGGARRQLHTAVAFGGAGKMGAKALQVAPATACR